MQERKRGKAMNHDVETKIRTILSESAELLKDIREIEEEERLDNLGVNSIDFIRVVVGLESEFQIEFEDSDLDFTRLNTIGKLAGYVQDKLAGQTVL